MGVSDKSDVRGDVKVPQGTMALRVQGYLEMLCSMIGCVRLSSDSRPLIKKHSVSKSEERGRMYQE